MRNTVSTNHCLRGQVDKEEDYNSRGWEFKSSWVSTTKKRVKIRVRLQGGGGS